MVLLIAAAVGGAILYALSKNTGTVPQTQSAPIVGVTGTGAVQLSPPSPVNVASGAVPQPPVQWPPNPGQPGYVTIGGAPAPSQYSMGDIGIAMKAGGLAGAGVGLASGVAHGVTEITGSAILPSVGAALPIIGAGIAAVGIVLSIISQHHQQAMAKEASTLLQASPILRQRQVLIAQAAILGEVSYSQAVALVAQCISDYYLMVSAIQRGKWTWKPSSASDAQWTTWHNGGKVPGPIPDPCNAACWYGHFACEGDCYNILLPTIQKIIAGQHGVMVLPKINASSDLKGYPEVDMIY